MATTNKSKTTTPKADAQGAQTAMTAPNPEPTTTAIEEYEAEDYGDDAGQGFENQDQHDRRIPILQILQDGSPIVKKKEAGAGQIINSVTGELYDAVDFVPAITDRCFTRWVPRDPKGVGGGFRGRHAVNDPVVQKAIAGNGGRFYGKIPVKHVDAKGNQLRDKDGKPEVDTELTETFEVACVVIQAYRLEGGKLVAVYPDDGVQFLAMLSFNSTKIAPYKDWNTEISMFQVQIPDGKGGKRKVPVPLFAHRVRMATRFEEKNSGYYVQTLDPASDTIAKSLLKKSDLRYTTAKKLHDDILEGGIRANYESTESVNADAGGDGDGTAGKEKGSAF